MYIVLKKDEFFELPKMIQGNYPIKAAYTAYKRAEKLAQNKKMVLCEYELVDGRLVNGRLIKDFSGV
jgi:hypothetical protein